jgi:hypothetical protein
MIPHHSAIPIRRPEGPAAVGSPEDTLELASGAIIVVVGLIGLGILVALL